MRRVIGIVLAITTHAARVVGDPVCIEHAPSLARTAPSARARVARLPARAWPRVRRIALPTATCTPASLVVGTQGETLAVGIEAPGAVAFVQRDGSTVTTARLVGRPEGTLAVTRDGRVLASAGLRVSGVTPDGAVRSVTEFPSAPRGQVFARDDGTLLAYLESASSRTQGTVTVVEMNTDGDAVRSRSLSAQRLNGPVLLSDNRLAVVTSQALLLLDARGAVVRAPTFAGARHIVALDDGGVAIATDTTLSRCDRNGAVVMRTALAQPPQWLAALQYERIAVGGSGASPHMTVFDRHGAQLARGPMPADAAAPLVDGEGAMLLVTPVGEVIAFDANARERWRMSLGEALRLPAVALPSGGVAIATTRNALVVLEESAPDEGL
jgi:hypothetical protein